MNDRSSPVRWLATAVAPVLLFTGAYALARTEIAPEPEQPKLQKQPESEPGRFPRPFEERYDVSLAVAIVALVPFIVVSTAYAMFSRQIQADLHVSRTGTEIVAGLSTAGYAFGALLAGDLVQRLRQRRMFLACEALFVFGCIASAAGHGIVTYGMGRVVQGFATGLLLVAALPPVIQRFPPEKLPITVVWINIGFFGAVCIGPLLGGAIAAGHDWRWFFAGLGGIAAVNLLAALLTLPKKPPMNPDMRFDAAAIMFALAGVALPFWASGELASHGFASPWFAVPMGVGLVCFIALLLVEYNQAEPVSPVKLMWTTPSVVGTLAAMIGGGVFVTFIELAERMHMEVVHRTPLATGLLLWPLAAGVCFTAAALGALLRTRFLPLLVLFGMCCLIGGGALLLLLGPAGSRANTLAAAGLLGLGAGATVSPGLYLAGFPLASRIIGRVFALVELVRSLADYIMAPVLGRIAEAGSFQKPLDWPGVREATWIALWITIAFTVIGTAMWIAGGMGLPVPDLRAWIKDNRRAIEPTPLLARLRRNPPEPYPVNG